jgi:choline kinase
VGFFRFSAEMAQQLAETSRRYLARDRRAEPHEEALRDLLLTSPEKFGFEDVTGLPWIEIDFTDDIDRARNEILPLLTDR